MGLKGNESPPLAFLMQQNVGIGRESEMHGQLVNIPVSAEIYLFPVCLLLAGKKKKNKKPSNNKHKVSNVFAPSKCERTLSFCCLVLIYAFLWSCLKVSYQKWAVAVRESCKTAVIIVWCSLLLSVL